MQRITKHLLWLHGKPILFGIFLAILLAFLIPYRWISVPLLVTALGLLIFSIYFFRNPNRSCPRALQDPFLIVSPADGRIVEIKDVEEKGNYYVRISIFLSPFDVHVNRVPVAGTVAEINYRPGAFIVAYAPKSSEINERNDLILVTHQRATIIVRQIAGFVARRICWWVHEGSRVATGEQYGMIRFGSRVDLFVPRTTTVSVTVGNYVYGGQTPLGRLSDA